MSDRIALELTGLESILREIVREELHAALTDATASESGPACFGQLVTLDELVALLPSQKSEAAWKRWLYEHLRRSDEAAAMGAVKLAGSWFVDRERFERWCQST